MLPLLLACTPSPTVPPGWTVERLPDNVLGRRFLLGLEAPGEGRVRCEAEDDPLEAHEIEVDAPEGVGDAALLGLLADTAYACEGEIDGVSTDLSFRTDPLPDWLPRWHLEEHDDPYEGYVLLNHGSDERGHRDAKLLIIDTDGRLRWYWRVPYDAADLDVSAIGPDAVLFGGGYTAPPTLLSLEGEVVAQAPWLAPGWDYNHHVEQLADGTVLTLVTAPNSDGGPLWFGFEVRILDPSLGATLWRWNSQRAVDEGWLPPAEPGTDPYHANAVGVSEDGGVWVNLRSRSELVMLDRATGDRRWTLGPGKDFRLVDEQGAEANPAAWFYMPHAPELHGDHLLFYDNGLGRPAAPMSRVLDLAFDVEARTARVLWSFTEPGWYEPIWGDVDLLPDGRVSYTRAHCDKCSVLTDQRTQVVEVDPADDRVTFRLVFEDPHDAGYRSERLDGCAVFANARYCPER
ncbi:MAG: aryl-sulfate sulfotransferase [Alphaproteobacteria bacterium]|nr:aryl-sulfate sulfotransferase [Alphaproteobacteria bacterium]MCB9694553.1 aryl-sulfate sulfotransferase [Alphaproteobacteria bacterium]